MPELDGQLVIVTGSSRGIGFAIAEALAVAGARVAVTARSEEGASSAAAALGGAGGQGFACDVAQSEQCRTLVAQVEDSMGPVTGLINNAGIMRDNILVRMKDEDFEDVIATNLRGAFNMIRAVARGMMKRRAGRIVNITSVVGLTGNRGQANYAASKAGLIGLTKSAALELSSRQILVNAIAPGFIETEMTGHISDEAREAWVDRIPLGRLGTPEDVAGVVRFLLGPSAAYMTGQVLVVDGGMVM
jgi:3-oxoacyl-[acyl-carrier protein] reductase